MEAVMQRVELLLDQRRFSEARSMIMQRLADEPDHPYLNAFLAYCLRMEDRDDEALEPARRAASRAPEWPFVHYVLAMVHEGLGQPKLALECIAQAIQLDPLAPSHYGLQAAILFQTRQWAEAIKSCQRGLAIDPQHAQCRGILTAAKNQLGQHEEVEHLVNESLRLNPENAFAFANKGWSCLRQGDPKEAIRHFKEALRLEPELEWARQGALESLKARNIAYRGLLAFFFKMGTLPQNVQVGIMIGLFAVYQLVRAVGRSNPDLQPYVTPLVVAYLLFCYATWVGTSLANCALLFHPFGRLAMTRQEKQNALVLGAVLLGGVACIVVGLVQDSFGFLGLGGLLVMITLPLVGTQNAGTNQGRTIGLAMTGAILGFGLLGIFVAPHLSAVALLLWAAYVWAVGHYVTRN
jgi:tetratricopeptide (TPR) repeat protein